MDHFSVLLVDDNRREILELAEADFHASPNVHLRTAANREDAVKLIKEHFFHLALIDPQLNPDQNELTGFFVLKALKDLRPSCERIILTYMGRDSFRSAEAIALQMHPEVGFAQGLLIKNDTANSFRMLIENRAKRWLTNHLDVEGADTVAQRLRERFSRRHSKDLKVAVTAGEIDFLISKVFGQGEPWNLGKEGLGIHRIVLDLIPRQGFSLAAVAKATCYSAEGVAGNKCVLKFATREYIQQELVRYSQYVRHRLIVHHRVELLGWEFADNFGVLCYNFASETSLSDLFLKQSPAFFDALDDLFSPGKKSWYTERGTTRLGTHFNSSYGLNTVRTQEQIRGTIQALEKRFDGVRRNDQVTVCGSTLTPPDDVLPKRVFSQMLPACVIHGDLHCDNVLVSYDGKPMLIDYFSVASGPLAVDFAVLEGSVRLLALQRLGADGKFTDDPRPDDEVIPEILGLCRAEEQVWAAVWGAAEPPVSPGTPTWESSSIHVGKKVRDNFETKDLSEEQYAATCLLWAMRLFKIEGLSDRVLARLLVWISSLVRVLKVDR